MDHQTKSDIESNFRRIDKILGSNIFHPSNSQNPLFQSALIELLIRVRDLMAKSRIHAERVDFEDDIIQTDNIDDVTDLITFIRNAVCHIDSDNHNLDEINARLSFNAMFGKGSFAKIGDVELKSDYDDDVCFFFGAQKVYLNRHLVRAYKEAKQNLIPEMKKV
ncbi:hypothetical protein [Halalkalibaculum sp. DA384]|uniref:hypothetical protein n=1 Tax=Halalkalibaculum sp. DA384 TaxID=3373606 RepID=UPI003755197E